MKKNIDIILKYFPDASPIQVKQFDLLYSIYLEWNSKINVISRKDMDSFYEHHVLHSLGIAKILKFQSQAIVLDVGTGGGFPGIPLAILFPEVQFELIDSIRKKIKVVRSVVAFLELKNITADKTVSDEFSGSWNVKYSMGPVSVGYSEFHIASGLADNSPATTAVKTVGTHSGIFDGDMMSIAFNVNDNLSLSWSEMTATYDP